MNSPWCGGSPNNGYRLAQNFFDQIYGVAGVDFGALTLNYVGAASGVVWGTNPCYTLSDFLAIYPKFFGAPTVFTGSTVAPARTKGIITIGSPDITVTSTTGISDTWGAVGLGIPEGATVIGISGSVVTISEPATVNGTVPLLFFDPVGSYQIAATSAITGLKAGMILAGTGVASGALVASVSGSTITLTKMVTATATGTSFNYYQSPPVPLLVIQLFINVAQASIMQGRWFEAWPLGMALYIAHYVTLWMRTETGPTSTAAQIVAGGLQVGIATSKSVGDVSIGLELVKGFLEDWGSYNQTEYGIEFATFAASVGAGPIWVGSSVSSPGGYFGGPGTTGVI